MTNPTIAQLLAAVNRRCGPLAALGDPHEAIFLALAQAGYSPSDPARVTDADLAAVPMSDFPRVADLATWRLLEAMCRNCTADELKRIGVVDAVDKVLPALRMMAERAYAYARQAYGVGLPTLSAGLLVLDAVATFDPTRPRPY